MKKVAQQPENSGRPSGRRQFLAGSLGAACGAALTATGAGIMAGQANALPAPALRPPGALSEENFTATCVRCGLCVRDCPYHILKLARFGDGVAPGTPFFRARELACEMCSDIPCVQHCPTGVLDHGLQDIDRARMGLAALIDQENCLNFLGLRCDVCHRVCPLINQAITLVKSHNPRSDRHALFIPTVHSEKCTGCGKCEKACVLEEAAIKVFPIALARGKLGSHYLKGWEEKEKAGRSLLEPMETPNPRLPEDANKGRHAGNAGDVLKEGFK